MVSLFPTVWLVFVSYRNFGVDHLNINLRYTFMIMYFRYIQMYFHQKLKAGVAIEDIVNQWLNTLAAFLDRAVKTLSPKCHRILRFFCICWKVERILRGTTLGGDDFTDILKFCHLTAKWGLLNSRDSDPFSNFPLLKVALWKHYFCKKIVGLDLWSSKNCDPSCRKIPSLGV